MSLLTCGDKQLDISSPQIMGILNVTPDSFSDGGQFLHVDNALRQVEKMIANGASIIDVGGESTRPGAAQVTTNEELARVIPLITAIKQRFDIIVSVDSSKPEVMRQAWQAGAGLLNDVRALQLPGALQAAVETGLPVCLMHMQGEPVTMQNDPRYLDVVGEVSEFFKTRIQACQQAGLALNKLLLDPGFGFGKTLAQNYQLLANLQQFNQLGCPLLVGISRKSMIGNLLNRPVEQRLAGSIAAAVIAAANGATIIRVHDVAETVDAIKVLTATQGS